MQLEKNKLLQRQLKSTIIDMKFNDLTSLLHNFQNNADIESKATYKKKGLKCAECTLALDRFIETGYGRSEQEAFGNAIKSLFDIIITNNYKIQQLKRSLKFLHKSPKVHDETLDLTYNDITPNQNVSINNLSIIKKIEQFQPNDFKKKDTCNCIYSTLFEEQKTKISNLQARLKLMNQQNSILKQLLLKDYPNKQNRNLMNRTNLRQQ